MKRRALLTLLSLILSVNEIVFAQNEVRVANEIPKDIQGTYLNEPYLNYLKEFRSHTISINKAHRECNVVIDELIISSKGVLFIYNLHEGITGEIQTVDNNSITLKNSPYESHIEINNNTINFNNTIYHKITDDITPGPSHKIGVKKYITHVIFQNKVYTDIVGGELYSLENGNVFYKNKEFEFDYSYILQNEHYDELSPIERSKYWPPEDLWIEINNGQINIYSIKIPDGYDDIDWKISGEFILINSLKEKM